jgi:hypothetical protein
LQFARGGLDVVLPGLLFKAMQLGEFAPVFEVVVGVLIIFNGDDLRTAAIEQSHGSTNVDDADGHVEPIQH